MYKSITSNISAMRACWASEQWFSMDSMTGNGDDMNACRLIASTAPRNDIFVVKVCP